VAAFLSFLWPGLGQWYAGRLRPALVYAVPVAIVIVAIGSQMLQGLTAFALQLFDPAMALNVLVLVVAMAGWRILSMVDASAAIDRANMFRGRPGRALIALALVVLVSHGVLARYAWSFYENGSQIFVDDPIPTSTPGASAEPSAGVSVAPTPFATPETPQSRVTILLTGIDKADGRTHSLTDTMLILTVDPATGRSTMISFPRDISRFPLYGGGTFNGKINSLMTWAQDHPEDFPDGPLPTLARELGFLLGIPVHYYAAVDLDGFRQMIDEVGGVTVTVDRPIRDYLYDWLDGSPRGFFLDAGTQTLDGRTALAFVRSRRGSGDNDFTRAARQQQLLLALRSKLTDPLMLPRLPAILDIAGNTIKTNFPPERIDEMLELARGVDDGSVQRYVLQPPKYSFHPPTNTTGGIYILTLKLEEVRKLSVELFGQDSDFWSEGSR